MTSKNIFGTDGIRARVGTGLLTQKKLCLFGRAIALWAQKKYNKKQPHILITHDTRASYSWVKASLKSGLLSFPTIIYDAHTLPTPAALVLMQEYGFLATIDCALIISASHNPYHDNGIKIMDHSGKLSSKDTSEISQFFDRCSEDHLIDYRALGNEIIFDSANKLYCAKIITHFKPNFLQGIKIVLDCAHGATYQTAPHIFKTLGADIITINNKPSGYNINEECGATSPQNLKRAVLEHEATMGFAFDGDGDRVVAVNQQGEIKDGDDIVAILLQHKAYSANTAIVGTTMTNLGLEEHLMKQNKQVIRSDIGDKNVIKKMLTNNLSLGGEQSGHIILGDLLMTGDGVLTALRVVESMLQNKNMKMESFKKYPQLLLNIPVEHKHDLTKEPFRTIIAQAEKSLGQGRILVRYSGTENLLRVMVESQDTLKTETCAQKLQYDLRKELTVDCLPTMSNKEKSYDEKKKFDSKTF